MTTLRKDELRRGDPRMTGSVPSSRIPGCDLPWHHCCQRGLARQLVLVTARAGGTLDIASLLARRHTATRLNRRPMGLITRL